MTGLWKSGFGVILNTGMGNYSTCVENRVLLSTYGDNMQLLSTTCCTTINPCFQIRSTSQFTKNHHLSRGANYNGTFCIFLMTDKPLTTKGGPPGRLFEGSAGGGAMTQQSRPLFSRDLVLTLYQSSLRLLLKHF